MPLRDLVFAGRTLRKNPIFALTAILTVILGVGASTTIFSVTNAVLLRPLPLKDPHRLVIACSDMRKRNVRDFPFSNADFIDLREGTKKRIPGFSRSLHRSRHFSNARWNAPTNPLRSGHNGLLSLGRR
jgi:hypothetical protein